VRKKAIDFLREMPHEGPYEVLIEACCALGFKISTSPHTYFVSYNGTTVATITGEAIQIISIAADGLAKTMPPVTSEQGGAFDKVLSRLDRNKIAVHEAGHAVAAFHSNLDINFVQLGEVSEMELCCDCGMDSLNYGDQEEVEVLQKVWAAGAAAEQIIFGAYRPYSLVKDRRDIDIMEKIKLDRAGKDFQKDIDVFDEYFDRAIETLKSNEIEAVANVLKEKSRLSGPEVEAILRETQCSRATSC